MFYPSLDHSHNLTYTKRSGTSRTTMQISGHTVPTQRERNTFVPWGRTLGSCQHSSVCRFVLCPFPPFSVLTQYSGFVFKHTQQALSPTLVAFFMNLTLSFSMSCQERMGVFSSSPTTMPGPCVGGPPVNSIILAPVFGNVP